MKLRLNTYDTVLNGTDRNYEIIMLLYFTVRGTLHPMLTWKIRLYVVENIKFLLTQIFFNNILSSEHILICVYVCVWVCVTYSFLFQIAYHINVLTNPPSLRWRKMWFDIICIINCFLIIFVHYHNIVITRIVKTRFTNRKNAFRIVSC